MNPSPDEFTWQPYEANAALLASHHVSVLDVVHDAPLWSKDTLSSLPRDLLALYKFTENAASHLGTSVSEWEFWNEPDTAAYCADSAWDFASAQKAAYLGWKHGHPGTRILLGSSAIHPGSRFFDVAMENLGGNYFDIYNLHAYGSLEEYPVMFQEARGLLDKS